MVNVPVIDDNWISDGAQLADNAHNISLQAIVVISLFSIVFVFSAILNIVFLVFYLRKPSLRNVSNKFIFNLCICNVGQSFIILPIVIIDDLYYQSQGLSLSSVVTEYVCKGFNVAMDVIVSEAVFSTALIATDRFFAITDPLHYYMMMTKNRSLILILLSWILAIVVGVVSFFSKQTNNTWNVCEMYASNKMKWEAFSFASFSMIICFLIPFIIILWAYAKIYLAAQQNSERTRRSSLCSSPDSTIVGLRKLASRSPSTRSASSHLVSNIRRRISNASLFLYKEEARTAKISVAVVILFLFCFLPFYSIKLASTVIVKGPTPGYAYKIGVLIAYLYAMLSPYLYVYRSKQVKKELYKRLGISYYDYEMRNPPYRHINLTIEPPSLSNSFAEKITYFGKDDIENSMLLNGLLTKNMLQPTSTRASFAFSSSSSTTSTVSSASSQLLHVENVSDHRKACA